MAACGVRIAAGFGEQEHLVSASSMFKIDAMPRTPSSFWAATILNGHTSKSMAALIFPQTSRFHVSLYRVHCIIILALYCVLRSTYNDVGFRTYLMITKDYTYIYS